MSGDVQMELYLHEYKMDALSSVLAEQGSSVEKRMQEILFNLYNELVPLETREEIQSHINAEHAAWEAEQEAARKFTAFRVRQDGADVFFQLDHSKTFLDIAKFLRSYLRKEQTSAVPAFENSFPGSLQITEGIFDRLTGLGVERPGKITGVFDLDFDEQTVSVIDPADGWRTYRMKDVSTAVYHASRKSYLPAKQYEARFAEKLAGRQITSAGHLSARDILLAEEICEMDGQRLNFYLETSFDVDAVFGTHVCTEENDDTLNVYADYDMAAGQVCDTLKVNLHRADGREESLEYRLNAAEKAVLLRKMEDYCQEQTGQTLKEYSAQLMAEEETQDAASAPQERRSQTEGPTLSM